MEIINNLADSASCDVDGWRESKSLFKRAISRSNKWLLADGSNVRRALLGSVKWWIVQRPAIHKQLVIVASTWLVTDSYIDTRWEKIDWRNVNKRLIKWEERWYSCCGFARNSFADWALRNANRLAVRKAIQNSDIRTTIQLPQNNYFNTILFL